MEADQLLRCSETRGRWAASSEEGHEGRDPGSTATTKCRPQRLPRHLREAPSTADTLILARGIHIGCCPVPYLHRVMALQAAQPARD